MKQKACCDRRARRGGHLARFGLIGLALGLGYAWMRAERKNQSRRWQAHMTRAGAPAALVTGASAGIGRAYAERLAGMGYHLVLVARRVERLEAIAAEIRRTCGVSVQVLPADLSTEEGIARVEQYLSAGEIDFLLNNAGYDEFGPFVDIPIQENLDLIRCLELAPVRLAHAALPGMIQRRRGAVVNVSSIGAFTAKRFDAVYTGSKAFLNRFTESLALDLRGSGVRVQALCPGFTQTEFHDAPEYAQYHIKERIPAWLWMQPRQVVDASLQALGEGRVVCVPGILNQAGVSAAQIGLTPVLMRFLAAFMRVKISAWSQPAGALDLLACPRCHAGLVLEESATSGSAQSGELTCPDCAARYPIVEGIPRFAGYTGLGGLNRRFAGLYDWFSIFYRLFSKVAFAYIGSSEEEGRFEILDRLEPCGRVLEVSTGPGVNLPYLREYTAVSEIYGLDLSNGQISACRRYAERKGWPVALFQGNAECLPFQDNAFDSVFHVGGINFFNDKRKAITEMIRVARPGAKIVICDESERGARGYELALPGFKRSFGGEREPIQPPVDLIPPQMEEVVLDESVWKGWFYIISFRKPCG